MAKALEGLNHGAPRAGAASPERSVASPSRWGYLQTELPREPGALLQRLFLSVHLYAQANRSLPNKNAA